MADSPNMPDMYSPTMGFIYVFNLIVGTGALTMPKAFAAAGWVAGVILLILLAFMSYLSTTFVIEVMAIANAKLRHQKREREGKSNENVTYSHVHVERSMYVKNRMTASSENINANMVQTEEVEERRPLLDTSRYERKYNKRTTVPVTQGELFHVSEQVEMAQMAEMYFSRIGRTLFYLCIIIYLYGDLAIYAAAVPKTLRDIACGNLTCSALNVSRTEPKGTDICWSHSITRDDAYRIFLGAFVLVLGPFTFFNVQKTKYLQVTTSLLRWMAFGSMVVMTIMQMSKGKGQGHPAAFEFTGLPTLFGVCVYSFMCQHSLPSLITPIRNKDYLSRLMGADYLLILGFYLLLCFTAIFCFNNTRIMDMYTLNFQESCDVTSFSPLRYFLGLFPVFTLSTNFPIIAVTLRNNLKAMLDCNRTRPFPFIVDRIFFPLLALIPPVVVAFITNDLTQLVGYTGSYAGTGVQYVIPAFLVLLARRDANRIFGINSTSRNSARSPFKSKAWIILMFVWASICLIFVTANHIMSADSKNHLNGTLIDSKWSWLDVGRYFFRKIQIP